MNDKPFTITNVGQDIANVIVVKNDCAQKKDWFTPIMVSFDNKNFTELKRHMSNHIDIDIDKGTISDSEYDIAQANVYYNMFVIKLKPKSNLYIKIASTHYLDKIIDNIWIKGSKVVLSGNINSLLSQVYLDPSVKLPKHVFMDLFHKQHRFVDVEDTTIISAEDLELPSLKLNHSAYLRMFINCAGLIHPPKVLPARSIPTFAYANMFHGCKKLQAIPNIQANIFEERSCPDMFTECKSLTDISNFPRKIKHVQLNAFDRMFFMCNKLKTLPSQIDIKESAAFIGIKMFDSIDKDYNYPLITLNKAYATKGTLFRLFPGNSLDKCNYPMSVFFKGEYIW